MDLQFLSDLAEMVGLDIPDDIRLDLWPPESFADKGAGHVDISISDMIVQFDKSLWSKVRFEHATMIPIVIDLL